MANEINDSAHWREYQQNQVTHSNAHYLMAIDSLRTDNGYARVTDVAERLEVSRGAASMAISHLKKRGWVEEDPNRFLLLSEDGTHMAHLVEHNFVILSKFFEEVLGAPHDIALGDACKMEHLMSLETGRRMLWFMRYILGDETRAAKINELMTCYQPGCETVDNCPLCDDDCVLGPEFCTFHLEKKPGKTSGTVE